MTVGIDGLAFQPGSLRLDLKEVFAPATNQAPAKFSKGLGLSAIALPDANEDIVTMGADAALELMQRHDLSPDDIGRIDVATESSFDRAKPAATYIAGCLEQRFDQSFTHADKGERKFACIAGTQAVNDACNWVQAGVSNGQKAIVIATDTAFYERGDAGEATQGAGAVAMLIDEDPDVAVIERTHGYGSADEVDFLKPDQQFPSVDGQRSIQVYLSRMREAIAHFEAQRDSTLDPNEYALAPFHTPFPKMVRKASVLGFRHAIRGSSVEDVVEEAIGARPAPSSFEDNEVYMDALADWTEDLTETAVFDDWYDRVVEPTLDIAAEVGNWYTGSVHVARLSGLQHAIDSSRELTGEAMLVASYGSGAQAEVRREVIQEGWQDEVNATQVDNKLQNRVDIETFETYRDLHKTHDKESDVDIEPLTTPTGFVRTGNGAMGERTYTYTE